MDPKIIEQLGFKDIKKKVPLVGAAHLLLGFFLLMVSLSGIILFKIQAVKKLLPIILSSGFIFVFSALFFIAGIGYRKTKRWARKLSLITSWLWLIAGIVLSAFFIEFIIEVPDIEGAQSTFFAYLLLLILFPMGFIIFALRKNVKNTLLFYNPEVNFLDKFPNGILVLIFYYLLFIIFVIPFAVGILFQSRLFLQNLTLINFGIFFSILIFLIFCIYIIFSLFNFKRYSLVLSAIFNGLFLVFFISRINIFKHGYYFVIFLFYIVFILYNLLLNFRQPSLFIDDELNEFAELLIRKEFYCEAELYFMNSYKAFERKNISQHIEAHKLQQLAFKYECIKKLSIAEEYYRKSNDIKRKN
ncbi:hypothetical protein KAU33_03205 [Candidatus Dependentiae bacterium]|nr:hypothetical protein [Candidatus Dependentiae bacterium]